MRVLEARAVISAVDRTGNTFHRVAGKMRRVTATADHLNRKSAMLTRGTSMLMAAPTRLLAAGGLGYGMSRSLQRFAETEMMLNRIGITANASEEEIAALQKSVRDLSNVVALPFNQVADGLNQLVTGGMKLPDAKAALPSIARTAQASGSEVGDISNSALALAQNFGIAADQMQSAFDVLVAGGKAGKFELKDIARYLPSLAPAAAAVGMKGEEGLKRLVAMLQTVRMGTGKSEEAAVAMQNVFAKMESEETAKRFKKHGIDLRAEMAKARREGKDLLEVFIDLTQRVTKGDLSKIPQIFSDMQFATAMRALLSFRDTYKQVLGELEKARGAVDRDLPRVLKLQQAEINRLSEAWDRATSSFGALISKLGGSTVLQSLAKAAENLAGFMDWVNQREKREDEEKRDPPKTIPEMRSRMREQQLRTEINKTTKAIENTEHDLAAVEASQGKSRFARDPEPIRRKLQALREQRQILQLELEAQKIPFPAALVGTEPDPDGPKPRSGPAPSIPLPRPRSVLNPVNPLDDVPARSQDERQSSPKRPETSRSFPSSALTVNPLDFSAENVRAIADALRVESGKSGDDRPVEAKLVGGADVRVTIETRESPNLISRIKSIVADTWGHIRMNGPPTGTTGLRGISMPEVGPAP